MLTWDVWDLHDDGERVQFTGTFRLDGEAVHREQFNIVVPATAPLVIDEVGRIQTQAGEWVLPAVEVGGEWLPRTEDPADPWARHEPRRDIAEATHAACRAYAERWGVDDGDRA
ncbi:hypothetical protein ACIGG9_16055 [Pseudonocardia alni]|uniref:hypothetical protein n=1 Tax=Pseudonocardia alni TaxID=33907 RepID=UPI0033C816FF